MNKYEKIDQFIKAWAQAGIVDPNFSYRTQKAHDMIYHNLTLLGVNKRERIKDLAPLFQVFQDYFKNYNNLNVQIGNYYCQLESKDEKAKKQVDNIKVYVPLDGNHIERGVKEIFAFLANNNIPHRSLVAKKVRFDDIIIGLTNEKDARKLLEFLKSNAYIQEGLLEPNPFAFIQNGIALSSDGNFSHNGTVASLIQMYMNNKKANKELEKASYADFFDYVAGCYTDEYIIGDEKPFERAFNYTNNQEAKTSIQQIISLVLKSQNPTYDLENFFSHFRKSLDLRNGTDTKELLLECVDAMSKKYQSSRKGIVNVESYVMDNIPERLTKVNNLRDRVVHSNMREDTLRAMIREKMTFKDYLKKLMDQYGYDPTQYDSRKK